MFDVVNQDDLRKWARFVLSCGVTAFVSFWSAFAATGGGLLYAGSPTAFCIAAGIFSGAGAMAAATLATARANELWKELTVILPKPPAAPTEQPPLTPPGAPAKEADRPSYLTG